MSGYNREKKSTNVSAGNQVRFVASQDATGDEFDDAAIEKRRQERIKRKQDDRRSKDESEDSEADVFYEDPKRPKRQKKKKARTPLWSDDQLAEDELLPDLELDKQRKTRRKRQTDWDDEWDV